MSYINCAKYASLKIEGIFKTSYRTGAQNECSKISGS